MTDPDLAARAAKLAKRSGSEPRRSGATAPDRSLRQRRARRAHPAAASRILAAGLSATALFGLVAALTISTPVPAPAATSPAAAPPPAASSAPVAAGPAPKRVIIIIRRHQPAGPSAPASSGSSSAASSSSPNAGGALPAGRSATPAPTPAAAAPRPAPATTTAPS